MGAELQRVLNGLLHSEVKDPRLEGVRVSDVELSADLGVARVYYATLDPDADLTPIEDSLRKASGFLRFRVGHEIRLRRVPELRFLHDESAKRGLELSRLIASTQEDSEQDPSSS